MKKNVLAIDFGASGGRAIVGTWENGEIRATEIHRFTNDPVRIGGTLYWDVLRLLHEIKQSLLKAKPYGIAGIGIDTWGVDFGLIDAQGRLLANPVHYRDARTHGTVQKALGQISAEELYAVTGNQIMEINTLFQLIALREQDPELLARADKLLLMPDLFAYFLTGEIGAERSIASTTQLYDQKTGDWAYDIADLFGIPAKILPPIQDAGSVRGMLSQEICEELGIDPVPVYAVCGHDTQSAWLAAPASDEESVFLSCGTWSLLGTERLGNAVLSADAMQHEMTNEVGYENRISFLRNITGLWLIQESRRQFLRDNKSYSYADMEQLARAEKPLSSFVDTDDPRFGTEGDLPARVREYCAASGQSVPETDGAVIRCIYESLALKYRAAISELSACTGTNYRTLHLFGGGTKDTFLAQMTADACGIAVTAGPIEATAYGNLGVQLLAAGEIGSVSALREAITQTEPPKQYEPDAAVRSAWDAAYLRYQEILKKMKGAG